MDWRSPGFFSKVSYGTNHFEPYLGIQDIAAGRTIGIGETGNARWRNFGSGIQKP